MNDINSQLSWQSVVLTSVEMVTKTVNEILTQIYKQPEKESEIEKLKQEVSKLKDRFGKVEFRNRLLDPTSGI